MRNTIITDSHYLISSIIQDLKNEQDNTYILDTKYNVLTDAISGLIEVVNNLKLILPVEPEEE